MTMALRAKPLSDIVRGIIKRDNGCWLDASDLSTMYQDAAGTTPVTAMEQPVGLWLDKSQGLQFGPELVTNGAFDTDLSGWLNSSGGVLSESYSSGKMLISRNGAVTANNAIGQTINTVVGRCYSLKLTIYNNSGALQVRGSSISQGVIGPVAVGTGSKEYIFKANDISTLLSFWPTNDLTSCAIDNISVRELKGNHATQSITASRPTLSARYNLLLNTENIGATSWTKFFSGSASAPVVSINAGIAPDGAQTAAKIELNVSGSTSSDRSFLSVTPNITPADSVNRAYGVWLKSADENTYTVATRINSQATACVIGQEWKFFPSTSSSSSDNAFYACAIYGAPLGGVATSTSAKVLMWHPQLNIGTTPLPYQRVNTATDYDTDGFARYLRFDGVDDYMSLPYMGLYANGSASVVTASALLRQTTDACTISEGNTADADSLYCMTRQLASGGNLDSVIVRDDATVLLDTTGTASALADGVASVRDFVDTGSGIKLFKNSGQLTSDAYTRSGTVTLNNTTIGAKVGTAASLFNNLMLYGLLITKSALSDSDRRKCEVYLGRKAGVQL